MAEVLLHLGRQIFDLSEVPPAARDKSGAAAIGYLTDILARLPEIPLASVPGGPGWQGGSLPARWTVPGTELRIVRLAGGPRAGDYVFSADTLAQLPAFHARIAHEPVLQAGRTGDWVSVQHRVTGAWLAPLRLDALPGAWQATLLDTPVWKILISLAVAAAILAIVMCWRRFVHRRAARVAHRRSQSRLAARKRMPAAAMAPVITSTRPGDCAHGGTAASTSKATAVRPRLARSASFSTPIVPSARPIGMSSDRLSQ